MKKFFLGMPFLSLLLSNMLGHAQIINNDVDEENIANKQYEQNQKDMQSSEQMHTQQSSCCFESRCGCQPYTRCCYPLPLPARCGWFFLEGEYLYWKAIAPMPYGVRGVRAPPFSVGNNPVYLHNVHRVDLAADSGYRVTLGGYFGDCYYGLARYTYFKSQGANDSFSVQEEAVTALDQQLSVIWLHTPLIASSQFESITLVASQRYKESLLDFALYRSFSCSRYNINPFVGVRFGQIKSDLSLDYFFVADTLSLPSVSFNNLTHQLSGSAGLYTGIDANMDLCWGFGLYGTSSFSALVGKKTFRFRTRAEGFNSPTEYQTQVDMTDVYKKTDFQTIWQVGVGLNWGTHFCRCAYYLGLKVGYELQYIPDFISFFEVDERSTQVLPAPSTVFMQAWKKSVFTHGLNVGLRFDF